MIPSAWHLASLLVASLSALATALKIARFDQYVAGALDIMWDGDLQNAAIFNGGCLNQLGAAGRPRGRTRSAGLASHYRTLAAVRPARRRGAR